MPTRRHFLASLVALPAAAEADPVRDDAAAVQAHPADALVDSIGVNIHAWPNTCYVAGNAWRDIILPALRDLGVRHLRDGMGRDESVLRRHAELARAGYRLTLITSPEYAGRADFEPVLDRIGQPGVEMLEGVNEPDGWWATTPGNTPARAVAHQRHLYAFAHPRGIPVLGSALIDPGKLRDYAEQAAFADFGNCHPYPSGRPPETPGWGANGYGSIQYSRDHVALALAGPGKPFIATEAGYNNAISAKAKARAGNIGCSEAAAAAYEPRLFLHYLNSGVARSFHYELMDFGASPDDFNANFGWLRHDGSRKPAFVAMRNLISILADPGRGFEPGRLAFKLTGETSGVLSCLMQKRDGTWFLALWLRQSLWDLTRYADEELRTRKVMLTLPDPVARIGLNRPKDDTRFTDLRLEGRSVAVEVTGHVCLLRISMA